MYADWEEQLEKDVLHLLSKYGPGCLSSSSPAHGREEAEVAPTEVVQARCTGLLEEQYYGILESTRFWRCLCTLSNFQ